MSLVSPGCNRETRQGAVITLHIASGLVSDGGVDVEVGQISRSRIRHLELQMVGHIRTICIHIIFHEQAADGESDGRAAFLNGIFSQHGFGIGQIVLTVAIGVGIIGVGAQ